MGMATTSLQGTGIKSNNVNINLPNPYDVYLKGVYGKIENS